MFGHQDDTSDQTNKTGEPQADATLAGTSTAATTPTSDVDIESSEVDEALKALAAHATPDEEPEPAVAAITTPASASTDTPALDTPSAPVVSNDDPRGAAPAVSEDETNQLLDLKQSALQQLTPLFDKLDQTAEERFRTSMMMIQASDNQSLLPTAYEAAQQIEDEKVKAQALLDVVNEINYFTQQSSEA